MRTPSVLLLAWPGDTWESNAQFRQLIYKHYALPRAGRKPLPTVFCNTFWSNPDPSQPYFTVETTAENQSEMIKILAPLGVEAVITDAGWYDGEWWYSGTGNWELRKDGYPDGIAPVAKAAAKRDITYGLWFEPERVRTGTKLHQEHPEWLLSVGKVPNHLLDFGLAEVRTFWIDKLSEFMAHPGYHLYRQDFNMNPYAFWRINDSPDRCGITEMKYVEGLYAYWDEINRRWPNAIHEQCASGGHRLDLGVVKRAHFNQKSDYFFDSESHQESLWALSQYLPNGLISTPLREMDDYSFHSALASSLVVAWKALGDDFDKKRAKELIRRYKAVRHLLVGAWYPLLPYSHEYHLTPRTSWIGSQYHRPDLDEGMLLLFRRPETPYPSVEVALRGLDPDRVYKLTFESTGKTQKLTGRQLMERLEVSIQKRPGSELIRYAAK